nr:reverse transcriptase domain-containing protein [Tanacetum cinerariifolium]
MIEESVEVFMDDFSVFGNSFDKRLNNLDKMLQRCRDAHLVFNWEKCHFMVIEGIVLGHKVSSAGLEVDKAKINVISKLSPILISKFQIPIDPIDQEKTTFTCPFGTYAYRRIPFGLSATTTTTSSIPPLSKPRHHHMYSIVTFIYTTTMHHGLHLPTTTTAATTTQKGVLVQQQHHHKVCLVSFTARERLVSYQLGSVWFSFTAPKVRVVLWQHQYRACLVVGVAAVGS